MPSLKEVKNRIASVQSTRKITSAMKMVASSKLHHAQQRIEQMRPYEQQLGRIFRAFVSDASEYVPYVTPRPVNRVALVLFTSNSSLCGGFNNNAIKSFTAKVAELRGQGIEIAQVFAVGRKGLDAVRRMGFSADESYCEFLDHPNYDRTKQLAEYLMARYGAKEIDACYMIYHHAQSSAHQVLRYEQYLPLNLPQESEQGDSNYIVEPSSEVIFSRLLPRVITLSLFAALLDSLASEHAARVVAMQIATDNADELLRSLQLQYNKSRQSAITAELLDIVGGSMQ
ncbi:MAG: ATP synthase F1 subunit gamma [Bacteroidaceae bacterium]|nr:ATP synthase F1 subunit gamma [Bacteroidaceae bacterium]